MDERSRRTSEHDPKAEAARIFDGQRLSPRRRRRRIVLGVLYESYTHPVTILSTLPSARVGAFLALMPFHTQFDIIGTIGVILLIGIVKKNAIMMIDFAIDARHTRNLNS